MSAHTMKAGEVDPVSEELAYLNYRDGREAGDTRQALVAYFGPQRVAELEARYQADLAERKAEAAHEELQGSLSREEARRA